MRRLPFLGTVLGAVLLTCGLLVMGAAKSERASQAGDLRRDVQRSTASFEAYFERARSLNLLLAQNPVFSDFYRQHHGSRTLLERHGPVVRGMDRALAYLQVLFPDVGEACFIDSSGKENARVVQGRPATFAELSLTEQNNPFFAPTFALPRGTVYQAAPYVSPDTHQYVISNSTKIRPTRDSQALVHFEVTLSSFLSYLPSASTGVHSAVIDRGTGRVVLDDGGISGQESAVPTRAPTWAATVADSAAQTGKFTVNGHAGAFRDITAARGNANDWVVVEWAVTDPVLIPGWAGGVAALLGGLLVVAALIVLRRHQQALRLASRLDHLTGLANRVALEGALESALVTSAQTGERCGVLVIDLDGFKQINDSLGHHRGDQVLQEIARRLHANTFEYDTAARLGGDEFAVVIQHLAGPDDALAVATRLHDALTRPIELDGVQRFVGASIGCAINTAGDITAEALLRNADAAMYAVKRDHAAPRLYEPGTANGVDELELAAELLTGIERDEITMHFQPQFDLRTGRVVAVEALARWQHPTRGLLGPNEFIPLAERTGLIRPLTVVTLHQALDVAQTWHNQDDPPRVSLNMSARLLTDQAIADEILAELDKRGFAGHLLAVEITESAIIGDPRKAIAFLETLRAAGVRVELDDFGSGYASFGHLRDLPLDAVKLDRSLISPLLERADSRDILRSTVDVIHALGYEIVGEGIEESGQLDLLRKVGCEIGQGYLYCRPMPADQLDVGGDMDARQAICRPRTSATLGTSV